MFIRKAKKEDLSRLGEILVFNNRMNYFPIFKDESFSFGTVTVLSAIKMFFENDLDNIDVYDDGVVKGFMVRDGHEITKLYVDTFFQGNGIGDALINYGVSSYSLDFLWALEKNVRAIKFYERHGFVPNGERKFEEDTPEYLVKLVSPAR